jgi:hypothetical protein
MKIKIIKKVIKIARLTHNRRGDSIKKIKVTIVYILTDFIEGC